MSKKMSKAPLYYTLAQIQFNPIAAMVNYINEIQDKFRLEGFTLFEAQKISQLHFNTSSAPSPKAEVIDTPIWYITKSDGSAGFILTQFSLAFHTTQYQTHKQFLAEVLQGIKILHSIIHFEHLSRIGLRYLNAVLPEKLETVNQYLIDGVHGLRFDATARYSLNESVFDTRIGPAMKGTLVNRIHHRVGFLGCPPDIKPHGLVPLPQFRKTGNFAHAVIDIDHFIEEQMSFNLEQIQRLLTSLHKEIKNIFNATTTIHAKTVWGDL